MQRYRLFSFVFAFALIAFAAEPARAIFEGFRIGDAGRLDRVNRTLGGRVLDYTKNHGRDNRLWCPSLNQWRDAYVYLPPGYDGTVQFPSIIWLHGLSQTEKDFLQFVRHFDEGIRAGTFPPVVIIAPDGLVHNRPSIMNVGSFYMNSHAGRFEDYIVCDLWGWAKQTFAIRPEREAHVIAGASMGGYGAFNLAFKHRDQFANVAGIMPPLDSQYLDCHGRYFANYDPNCVGRRTDFRRNQIIGRFGLILVRHRRLLDPVFGRFGTPDIDYIRRNNPIEMLSIHDIGPHDYNMFIAYGTADEFNIDAQVEHFLDVAARRGISPTVVKMEGARHNATDGLKSFPALSRWMLHLLSPYAPSGLQPMQCCRAEIQTQAFVTGAVRPMYLSPLPSSPGTLALR